mgnify:CR=1 FL=1
MEKLANSEHSWAKWESRYKCRKCVEPVTVMNIGIKAKFKCKGHVLTRFGTVGFARDISVIAPAYIGTTQEKKRRGEEEGKRGEEGAQEQEHQ